MRQIHILSSSFLTAEDRGLSVRPVFQNLFYTMCTTIVGFYLPAAIVSGIYFKLYVIFRSRVRTRVDREVMIMKKVDEMKTSLTETTQPQTPTAAAAAEGPEVMIKRLALYEVMLWVLQGHTFRDR